MGNRLLGALLVAGTVGFTGCDIEEFADSQRYKEDFAHSYPLKAGGKIAIENINGSVEIAAWEKNEVQITGTKYASTQDGLDSIKIDIVAADDAIRIRTIHPERRGNRGARYVLRVPARVELERIQSSNGGIRIEGIDGPARLKTSNGSVRVWRFKGPLEAVTSNASVELQEFAGSAVLRTSNGSIKADGVRGLFEATTSNSSIDARVIEVESGRPIKLNSSNGSINLTLDTLKGNDIIADTSNSNITIRLPSDIGAQVKASTSNASITTDFEVKTREVSKTRLDGTIGAGGPLIDLSTSNGNIRIQRL